MAELKSTNIYGDLFVSGNIYGSIDYGVSSFVGDSNARTITHKLGSVPRFVSITPSSDPSGGLGEVWYNATSTTISVYNSGRTTVGFSWMAIK